MIMIETPLKYRIFEPKHEKKEYIFLTKQDAPFI